MKFQAKIAGLCGSAAFLITAFPGFYQQTRPTDFSSISTNSFSGIAILETLSISVVGAIAVGMIGYAIGDILCKPQGKTKAPLQKAQAEAKTPQVPASLVENPILDEVTDLSTDLEEPEAPLIGTPGETAQP